MDYYDSHCHLNDETVLADIETEISECRKAGLSSLLCVGYDLESSHLAVGLSETVPEVIAAIGVHPENRDGLELDEAIKALRVLAKNSPSVKAIGEIGLDYHWYKDPEERKAQHPWFIAQIELANELKLPISIHARDASEDTYAILSEHPAEYGMVLHCYSGSVEMMERFVKLGCFFGFDGPITYKNAVTPKECVKACPIDRILVETDSPYLSPVPFRGKPNSPRNIPLIVSAMAELRGVSVEEMNAALWDNYTRLFRVKHG